MRVVYHGEGLLKIHAESTQDGADLGSMHERVRRENGVAILDYGKRKNELHLTLAIRLKKEIKNES